MNILISILNESCGDAKSNAEENAKELEMAGFIEERLMENFHEGSNRTEFKLFCDETIFFNMCLSETEPFYLNSECITRCTEERMLKVEKFEDLLFSLDEQNTWRLIISERKMTLLNSCY